MARSAGGCHFGSHLWALYVDAVIVLQLKGHQPHRAVRPYEANSRGWNQSQGAREHIPGVGTNHRGL
eukprot:9484044-Pyramimonas_sp.AAC.1